MKRFKRLWVLAGCMALLMAFAAGCGGEDQQTGGNEAGGDGPDNSKEEVRVIEHAMGKTDIKGTPQRIVTLYQGATDAAVALGVKPVGAVESWLEAPVYTYLRDDLGGMVIVGQETQPNLEEIHKLKPDLIIASKVRHEQVYAQLSQIAPTIVHETVYKFKETVEMMGEAMNKQDKAKELLEQWDSRTADFRSKIEAKLGAEWPIEVSVLNFRADHARIYVTGYAGDILEELGFVRSPSLQAEADKGTVVIRLTDKEGIPSMNADVFFIFLTDGHEEAVQKTYREWTSHPLWRNLDAAKTGKVYLIDEIAWNMAGGYKSAHIMLDQLYEHFGLEK